MKQPHGAVPTTRSGGAGAERLGREQTRKPNPSPREQLGAADPTPASPSAAAALSIPRSQIHPRSVAGTEGSGCGAATTGTITRLGSTKEFGFCPFLPPTSPKRCIGEVETRLLSEHGSAPLHGHKLSETGARPRHGAKFSVASALGHHPAGFCRPNATVVPGHRTPRPAPGGRVSWEATCHLRAPPAPKPPVKPGFSPPVLPHSPGGGQEWVV